MRGDAWFLIIYSFDSNTEKRTKQYWNTTYGGGGGVDALYI